MKKKALIEIHEKLLQAGLTDIEADCLVANLLEEEAENYVKYISIMRENLNIEEESDDSKLN